MAKKMIKKDKKGAVTKTKKILKKTSHTIQKKAVPSIGIRPLSDRVVIRPLSEDEMGTKYAFGIIIPDTVKGEKPEQGIVLAVGDGKYDDGRRVPLQVSVGDRVVFSKYGYDEVKVGGAEYYVVSESNLLAIIKN